MTACLVVSTEVQCFISVIVWHFQLYVVQERLEFDLDIDVKLREGLCRIVDYALVMLHDEYL